MVAFLFIYVPLVALPMLLITPAWFVARARKQGDLRWFPFVHVPAVTLWFALLAGGIGAQSLGNLNEGVILAGAVIPLAYAKVIIVDRLTPHHHATNGGLAILLLILAVALRAFIPVIPE